MDKYDFRKCIPKEDSDKCSWGERHIESRRLRTRTKIDVLEAILWVDVFDTIHCDLHRHTRSVASTEMKREWKQDSVNIVQNYGKENKSNPEDEEKYQAIRINNIQSIRARARQNKFKSSEKFNIKLQLKGTMIDGLRQYLDSRDVSLSTLSTLQRFLEKEEYETNSLLEDLKEVRQSNIANIIYDDTTIIKMQQHFHNLHCMFVFYS